MSRSTQLRMIATMLHASAASAMSYGYRSLSSTPLDKWIRSQKGGHMQFLTIQGLAVAWVTMLLSLGNDIFPTVKSLRALKRALFMIAMPLSVVISTIYWSLLLFLPNLILRRESTNMESTSSTAVPKFIRLDLNVDLALHAVPALTLLLDFILFERPYSHNAARRGAPLLSVLAALWYGSWVEYCASYNGMFPYPFLTENPLPIRMAIYFGACLLALLSFWALNSVHTKPILGHIGLQPVLRSYGRPTLKGTLED